VTSVCSPARVMALHATASPSRTSMSRGCRCFRAAACRQAPRRVEEIRRVICLGTVIRGQLTITKSSAIKPPRVSAASPSTPACRSSSGAYHRHHRASSRSAPAPRLVTKVRGRGGRYRNGAPAHTMPKSNERRPSPNCGAHNATARPAKAHCRCFTNSTSPACSARTIRRRSTPRFATIGRASSR